MGPMFFCLCLFLSTAFGTDLPIENVAGTGRAGFSGDGGPAKLAELNNPYGLTKGPESALYVCDMGNHRIRKIDANGIITTVAGSGMKGYSGDGGPALGAQLNEPYEVRFNRAGDMYFVEMRNNAVRRVEAKTGIITTVASGFNQPHSIQFVGEGELWICDIGNLRIQALDLLSGHVKTVGGTGEKLSTREGEPLLNNPLNGPRALDAGSDGTLWIALREGNLIYRAEPNSRRMRRAVGIGKQGFTGNDGPALEASLSGPKGISVSPWGMVYFADTESHTIRFLNPKTHTVHLLAGTGARGDGPEGDATKCSLSRPHGVYADKEGFVWIGDSENHRVRRVKTNEP